MIILPCSVHSLFSYPPRMHKNITLTLGGLAIIGVIAGASYISGGSLLSSVLTSTQPVCQEQENDVALATQALEQYPERANITERVTILEEAVKIAEAEEKKLADTITATVKKRTKYESLALLNRDLMQHKRLTTEVTRLTNIRPQTATIKTQLTAKKKELSAFNALVKKTTKSATTIDVLYKKYIAPLKELALHTAALEKLATAQRALITVQEEQSVITQAESRLTTAKEALETCRAKTPEIQKESVTYCFPIYQGADGVVQTNCVDDISKIPQCYVKSTTTEIYDDETGELSSVNVVPDDNTREILFCGQPEMGYLDAANPTSGYPTMPGQGSNPGAEAAAPMGAENPNSPRNNPVQPEDNETKKCES